jgi:hypothetical protein
VWCIKKPGRDLREKVELWLAWKRVAREVADGTLGGDFDRSDRAELQTKVKDAEEAAKEEVWGGYRFAVIADHQEADGLKTIDLGAGHSSSSETLCGRVIAALKSAALLNESVGAGYIDRNWPPAFKDSGAWPLASLRQSFLNGSLTRLLDPDTTLRGKIVEFVGKGDFGLASGQRTDGRYERVWFQEPVPADEVAFESGVFLLTKARAQALKAGVVAPIPGPEPVRSLSGPEPGPEPEPGPGPGVHLPAATLAAQAGTRTIRLVGAVPSELWNRIGTKLLPKLKSGSDLKIEVNFSVTVQRDVVGSLAADLRQVLDELQLADKVQIRDA